MPAAFFGLVPLLSLVARSEIFRRRRKGKNGRKEGRKKVLDARELLLQNLQHVHFQQSGFLGARFVESRIPGHLHSRTRGTESSEQLRLFRGSGSQLTPRTQCKAGRHRAHRDDSSLVSF